MKGVRLWNVKAGETLLWIAATSYGDARLWRLIADANKITDPLRFPTEQDIGRQLLIPGR